MASGRGRDVYGDKIIAGVERLSNLFRLLLWDAAKVEKLSPIQIQFLLFLHDNPGRLRTVSQLAREFCLTKATVSDAVKALVRKRLVEKRPSPQDGRVYTLRLTPAGRKRAARLSGWSDAVKQTMQTCRPELKETVALFLMDLIRSLQTAGVIEVARMCMGCRNFRRDASPGSARPHRCMLTEKSMGNEDLKLDCSSYEQEGAA
jgi:DNA-binding MarR family transcriptional regulator